MKLDASLRSSAQALCTAGFAFPLVMTAAMFAANAVMAQDFGQGPAVPRHENSVSVSAPPSVLVGDFVVTIGHDEKNHSAQSLVKLAQRWR